MGHDVCQKMQKTKRIQCKLLNAKKELLGHKWALRFSREKEVFIILVNPNKQTRVEWVGRWRWRWRWSRSKIVKLRDLV